MLTDQPMFDPRAYRLRDEEAALATQARELARQNFAARATTYDRDARFPTENYHDLRAAGLLAICVPRDYGGLGADYRSYCLAAAEIGRYCGATALTFNMHVCSCLWSGALADSIEMGAEERREHNARRARHYARIVDDGAIYAQPFSEGGTAAAGAVAFATTARPDGDGWRLSGRKIFASLSGHANYYGAA